MTTALSIVTALSLYALAGVLFAIYFVIAGAGRIDSAARGARLGFRAFIFPGSVALWPILLIKCIRVGRAHP